MPVVLSQAIGLGWRVYLPAFLAETVSISLMMVGILMMAARAFDAAADLAIGWVSDHLPSRFGNRKPWMALGVPIVACAAIMLFLAPANSSLWFVVSASLALHLGHSLIATPHGGWGLELSGHPHERTRIMGAKLWFGAAGSIATLLLLALLERQLHFERADLVTVLGVTIALLAPLSVGLVVSLFRERPPMIEARDHSLALLPQLFSDPATRRILLLYTLSGIADAASTATFLFLCDDVLGLGGWGATLMLMQPVMLLLVLPLWSKVSRRLGRERTLRLALGWQVMVMPLAILLPAKTPVAFAAFLVLRNLSCGVDYMLLRAMVADIVGAGIESGRRFGGSCYAVTSTALSLAMGVGAGGALWAIASLGFRPELAATGISALSVRLAYALPAIAAGIGGLLLLRNAKVLSD